MNILTYSSLYPNVVDPSHGIFVERRLRQLVKDPAFRANVVAPVPWFPFKSRLFGKYGDYAAIPKSDHRHNIEIRYPRYPLIPRFGMLSAPGSMVRASIRTIQEIIDNKGPVDIVDAHYFYPDGVAASRLAEKLGIPFVVTARGSDINLIATFAKPRRMMVEAARKAKAVIAVSSALGNSLVEIGVDSDKIHILRNGVDLSFFQPGNHEAARRKLNFDGLIFMSVGTLKEAKGHDVAIESLRHIQDAKLVIIGAGEYEQHLRKQVDSLGLDARVTFTGSLDPAALLEYYQAADALLLMSRREGMPNVVLESLACGTPVIATNVGGIGEVLKRPLMGELLQSRQPRAVADAWFALVQRGIDRSGIRKAAESFSWDETIARLSALMRSCAADGRH